MTRSEGYYLINPLLLDALEIPYSILSQESNPEEIINKAVAHIKEKNEPYALLIRKDTFDKYKLINNAKTSYELSREEAIKTILNELNERDIVVSTTGMASREVFEHREEKKQGHNKDFLTVGSMGHSSSIALGIALSKPDRQIYCLDGDGAALMHLGSMAIIGQKAPKNFKHIILNNGAHDSVGGQPTAGFDIDFPSIAKACGYTSVLNAETTNEIREKIKLLIRNEGPSLLEIKINKGHRENLGRPTKTPLENKKEFMDNLKK